MSHGRISRGVIGILFAGALVLLAAGCGDSKKMESPRNENMILNQRVAELEDQLQTDAAVSAASSSVQSRVSQTLYTVAEGDSLWSIAKKQLGSGARFKEIMALNPHITQDQPLKIGMKILLPTK